MRLPPEVPNHDCSMDPTTAVADVRSEHKNTSLLLRTNDVAVEIPATRGSGSLGPGVGDFCR